jgi:acyl-CoA synthetase (AMP-forming)/AMP-acid ligase II
VFRSGDLVYRDADGFFYFAGRTGEWLRVDGENLAIAPIERALAELPEVLTVAVYAVPDPQVGDLPMAAVEPRPGATIDAELLDAWWGPGTTCPGRHAVARWRCGVVAVAYSSTARPSSSGSHSERVGAMNTATTRRFATCSRTVPISASAEASVAVGRPACG